MIEEVGAEVQSRSYQVHSFIPWLFYTVTYEVSTIPFRHEVWDCSCFVQRHRRSCRSCRHINRAERLAGALRSKPQWS